ncbi:MAG: hypothetical protein K0S14_3555 [Thermomicrobiales bacterium]|nr:hypothetical protein [Thermomicrobiales bacterium]
MIAASRLRSSRSQQRLDVVEMATTVLGPLQLHLVQAADLIDQRFRRGRRGPVRRLRRRQNFGDDFLWRNPPRQMRQGGVDRLVIVWRGKDAFARESLEEDLRPPVIKRQMGERVGDRPTIRQFPSQVVVAEPRDEPPQALELLLVPGDMVHRRIQGSLSA